ARVALLIGDPVVLDHVLAGAALQQVPDAPVAKPASADLDPRDSPGVEAMAVPVAVSVAREERAFDDERRSAVVRRQDSVLVVEEARVAHDERSMLEADAGAVAVGHARADEVEAFDLEVPVADHPDPLVLCRLALGLQHGASADGADRQALLPPDRDVAGVLAGLDFDDVAAVRDPRRLGDRLHVAVRAHREGPADDRPRTIIVACGNPGPGRSRNLYGRPLASLRFERPCANRARGIAVGAPQWLRARRQQRGRRCNRRA